MRFDVAYLRVQVYSRVQHEGDYREDFRSDRQGQAGVSDDSQGVLVPLRNLQSPTKAHEQSVSHCHIISLTQQKHVWTEFTVVQ